MAESVIVILLPILLWAVIMFQIPVGRVFEMDWGLGGNGQGSFVYIYAMYRQLTMIIFYVGLVLAMVMGFVFRQEPACILLLSSIYAFLFNSWMTYCYESYCHAKWPLGMRESCEHTAAPRSNYTRPRYALTLALGYSSMVLFVIGLVMSVTVMVER